MRLEVGVGRSVDEDSSSLEVEVSLAGCRIARQVEEASDTKARRRNAECGFHFAVSSVICIVTGINVDSLKFPW